MVHPEWIVCVKEVPVDALKELFCRHVRVLLEFTQAHSTRNPIAFFAFPGRKGMGTPKVLISASFPVCAPAPVAVPTERSSYCVGKFLSLPGTVGSTSSTCCCFDLLFPSQLLGKKEFVSFSLKPGKQKFSWEISLAPSLPAPA